MADSEYTGTETATPLGSTVGVYSDMVFEVRAPGIPRNAVPVFDDSLGAVVGYRDETTTGVYRIYDLQGNVVGLEEKGLQSPAVDPLDLIFFVGGILRSLGKGVITGVTRQAPKVAALTAGRITAGRLLASVVGVMRMVFKGLAVRELKFTATTALRMATPGRPCPGPHPPPRHQVRKASA